MVANKEDGAPGKSDENGGVCVVTTKDTPKELGRDVKDELPEDV